MEQSFEKNKSVSEQKTGGEEPWADVYGETLIERKDGKDVFTERKSGAIVNERPVKEAQPEEDDPYYRLNDSEKGRVNAEIAEFESGRGAVGLSASELNEEKAKLREKLSRQLLESRGKYDQK